jgi:hypothetical protein
MIKWGVVDSTTEGNGINSRCYALDIDIQGRLLIQHRSGARRDWTIWMIWHPAHAFHWTMYSEAVKYVDFIEVDIMTTSPFVASKVAA